MRKLLYCPNCLETLDVCEELEDKTVLSCPNEDCEVETIYVYLTPEKETVNETLQKSCS